jgi:hypothetical protein
MQHADGSVTGTVQIAKSGPPSPARQRDRKVVWLFCLLAAMHVFVFSAAFPFFNNVDEPMHFDLVVKYSHGEAPLGKETVSPDSATWLALYSSCMYFGTPDKFPGGKMPAPPWTESAQIMERDLNVNRAAWHSLENYEVSQAPLYYVLTGAVWSAGRRLHMDPGHVLYCLRFFNVLLVISLIWLGYAVSRLVFPENPFLRLAVPALLVFMPQTAFYSITNDVLSPVCFGATFLCLLQYVRAQTPSLLLGAMTGLAFAATYFTKATNLPLLAVVAIILVFHAASTVRRSRGSLPAFIVFLACAGPPVFGWACWCKIHYGDCTGSKIPTDFWGWTLKPFADWGRHPIFSPDGLWKYLSGQLVTFWQGEFSWLNRPLILPGTTTAYTVLSLGLLAAALHGLCSRTKPNEHYRTALSVGLACFVASLAFFAILSIAYDFKNSPNPSAAYPYFRQGRLMLGALIPFLLLLAYGLDHCLNRLGMTAKVVSLAAMILGMLAVEIVTDWPVFRNPFNWYHLPN